MSDQLQEYYSVNDEALRLESAWGQLEFERSKDIITRNLPASPGVIVDVGGAAGRYSSWLSSLNYETHLVDPVPLLVDQARQISAKLACKPIASCELGDARRLHFKDDFADAALMLGPLYHLTERQDRIVALGEIRRVLKPKGILFAAGISRFASSIDGLAQGLIFDPEFRQIVANDLKTGQHRNPTGKVEYFTDAFFHGPESLRVEIEEAGFQNVKVYPIEGFAYLLGNLDTYWKDSEKKKVLLEVLRSLEAEPSLAGATAHLMCVATKA